MLAALAGVLMSLEFSVPLMPPFYKVDFSDVPSIVAVFLMGPVSGICVEVIKILIKLITVGTVSYTHLDVYKRQAGFRKTAA